MKVQNLSWPNRQTMARNLIHHHRHPDQAMQTVTMEIIYRKMTLKSPNEDECLRLKSLSIAKSSMSPIYRLSLKDI